MAQAYDMADTSTQHIAFILDTEPKLKMRAMFNQGQVSIDFLEIQNVELGYNDSQLQALTQKLGAENIGFQSTRNRQDAPLMTVYLEDPAQIGKALHVLGFSADNQAEIFGAIEYKYKQHIQSELHQLEKCLRDAQQYRWAENATVKAKGNSNLLPKLRPFDPAKPALQVKFPARPTFTTETLQQLMSTPIAIAPPN